jgi:hypothetical protein
MKKKPEDFTQAEVDAFQAAHTDKSVKLTDYQARCLMADYEGDKINDTGIIARDRLYEDMVASRKAAPSINSGKPPLDALRIPSYLEDPQAWSYLDYVARHGKDHQMDPLLVGNAQPDTDGILAYDPGSGAVSLVSDKHELTPGELEVKPIPDFYADCRAIDDVAIPTGFKDLNSFGGFKREDLILARARRLGSKTVQRALAHFTASGRPDHPIDALLMSQGGFKRGELMMIGSTSVPVPRLGNLKGRNTPVDSFASIMRNMAKSLTHMGYRMKLSTAYRILHPKKDKEGRLLPVRARGESEARMIARPMRDAAMARALRVVARHEEIQRLRREQNKKQFKKVKRHRKAWQ